LPHLSNYESICRDWKIFLFISDCLQKTGGYWINLGAPLSNYTTWEHVQSVMIDENVISNLYRLNIALSSVSKARTETFYNRAMITTLDIVFSITYYSDSCNAKPIYCITHFLTNKDQIGCSDITEHQHLDLVENYTDVKKY
jgi:hypothetical protein